MDNEILEVAKTTPPVTISALSLLGIQLSDWVYIFTLVYLMLQIIHLVRKLFRKQGAH